MSYIEIYNEEIRDLLDPAAGKTLAIREHSDGRIVVAGAKELAATTFAEMQRLLDVGSVSRTVAGVCVCVCVRGGDGVVGGGSVRVCLSVSLMGVYMSVRVCVHMHVRGSRSRHHVYAHRHADEQALEPVALHLHHHSAAEAAGAASCCGL